MDAITLRPYQDSDRDAVRNLLARCFGTDGALLRFEKDNPLGTPVRIVATMNDSMVGFNHWQPWRIPGIDVTVYQSGASAVDPAARGQGVFGKLLKAGEDLARSQGVSCFVGFPNPASLGSFLRAGWTHFASLPLYLYLRPTLSLRSPAALAPHPVPFVEWRYRAANVESRSALLPDGKRVRVFFRTEQRLGVKVIKLLDALSESGDRNLAGLSAAFGALPGPGAMVARCSSGALGHLAVRLRRKWETPAIFRNVRGAGAVEALLRAAPLCYGDIDAA